MNTATAKEQRRANVFVMRGHGEERLRQAIMQGLVKDEIAADIEEILKQLDEAKVEKQRLENDCLSATKRIGDYERIYQGAIGAFKREEASNQHKKELLERIKVFAALFAIVLLSTIISMIIARMILG